MSIYLQSENQYIYPTCPETKRMMEELRRELIRHWSTTQTPEGFLKITELLVRLYESLRHPALYNNIEDFREVSDEMIDALSSKQRKRLKALYGRIVNIRPAVSAERETGTFTLDIGFD
jgi:hypothetical protein